MGPRVTMIRARAGGIDDFANKALSAMRKGFGGQDKKKA